MNNKNILIAITPETRESSLLNFMAENLRGDNIRIVLCILNGLNDSPQIDGLLDRISLFCEGHNITVRIWHLTENIYEELENQTAYADLLIIQKKAIRHLKLNGDLDHISCPMIILPETFKETSNVLLFTDRSKESTLAIKQFAQVFAGQLEKKDVTVISNQADPLKDSPQNSESLLLEYLKQYAKNIGILKIKGPLTDRTLKPIDYHQDTLVVGTTSYLLSQYGEHSSFKPFFDERSSIFLPAD